MARLAAAVVVLVVVLTVSACSGDGDADNGPTGAPTVPATAATSPATSPTVAETSDETATPGGDGSDSTTGPIPDDLEAVLDAVEIADVLTLLNLLGFAVLACTDAPDAGGAPECEQGEASGTMVVVFPFAACEPQWLRTTGIEAALTEVAALSPVRLAVFSAPGGYGRVPGEYVAVFAGPDPRVDGQSDRGVAVSVRGGVIVEIMLSCDAGADPEQMIPETATDFLLRPGG